MARIARCLESLNQMPAEEFDDYCAGFNAGDEEVDENKSKAWLRGWAEAQESDD